MPRRATYPKRSSKRCAREGTPRAVSFRECGRDGVARGFCVDYDSTGRLQSYKKMLIMGKNPYDSLPHNLQTETSRLNAHTSPCSGKQFTGSVCRAQSPAARHCGTWEKIAFPPNPLDSSSSRAHVLVPRTRSRARGHASDVRPASRRTDAARGRCGEKVTEIEGRGEGRGQSRSEVRRH